MGIAALNPSHGSNAGLQPNRSKQKGLASRLSLCFLVPKVGLEPTRF